MLNELTFLITNVGFPIAITLILLKIMIPTMAKADQVKDLQRSILSLERNITVMTIVIARATKVDYQEVQSWVISNGNNEGGR